MVYTYITILRNIYLYYHIMVYTYITILRNIPILPYYGIYLYYHITEYTYITILRNITYIPDVPCIAHHQLEVIIAIDGARNVRVVLGEFIGCDFPILLPCVMYVNQGSYGGNE